MKRIKRAAALLAACALALSLSACSKEEDPKVMDPTVAVETSVADVGTLSTESSYVGTVSAVGLVRVIPMVSGTVEEVTVSVGDTVSAGQLLARFDDSSAQL